MIFLLTRLSLIFYITLAGAVSSQEPLVDTQSRYKLGDPIPVTCLNRTAEGEHITDPSGALQYIPFPTCNETSRPLELYFGIEKDINCTIDFVSDPFFHLLEYYVHNDSPFTCRIPSRPHTSSLTTQHKDSVEGQGSLSEHFIPLIIALTGTLQLSHLHVSNHLNVLLHAAPKSTEPGVIQAGTAYSIATAAQPATRIIIGDALPLRFSVRWYPNTALPSGWTGVGGHIYASTLVYCLLSALAATAVCFAYFRGIELPKRLRSHGKDRMGGGMEGGGASAPRLGGYGYGIGTANGYGGYGVASGKRD
ncbi:Hypothetical protein D9617_2g056170 [Elsinoe fawcettii]|nr:Hypothetical protein D9617_2g056170 [Elsinoe fawcettii]